MKYRTLLALSLVLSAGLATAHTNVQNSAVKARMAAMSVIGDEMKTLGMMAKGATPFDGAAARNAAKSIEAQANATPDLFRAQEDDPKSEAKDTIWSNFDDFTAKSKALESAAANAAQSLQSEADLGPAMAALGGTCKACHSVYRE